MSKMKTLQRIASFASLGPGLVIAVTSLSLGLLGCSGGGSSSAGVSNSATQVGTTLSGNQEVPAVVTNGSGSATLTLNSTQTEITYTLEYADTAPVTQSHLQLGAAGTNGGILLFLCAADVTAPVPVPADIPTPPTCPAAPGTVSGTLTAADFLAVGNVTTFSQMVDALLSGKTYINVHTTDFASGEIRGQIGVNAFEATLSGGEGVPPVTTMGSGSALLVLDAAQTSLFYRLEYADTSTVTQAHIHAGAAGVNGDVIFFLCETAAAPAPGGVPTPPTCPGVPGVVTGALTAADLIPSMVAGIDNFADAVAAIQGGDTYINVHSAAFPAGEIRGQIEGLD